MVTFYQCDVFSFVSIVASPSLTITLIFSARRPFFRFYACPIQIRRGTVPRNGHTTTAFRWVVPPILGRHTKPALAHDGDGGKLAHSGDTGFYATAVCLGIY